MAEKAHKLGVELVEYITKDEALQPSVFTDVKEGAYYVDAVNWGVDKKVTSGKTETTFAPTIPAPARRPSRSCGAPPAVLNRPQAR